MIQIHVVNIFSFNQNVPWMLSAHASGQYTCIKWCNLQMSDQFTQDFTLAFCERDNGHFVQMVQHY